jgi:hypothetical protein
MMQPFPTDASGELDLAVGSWRERLFELLVKLAISGAAVTVLSLAVSVSPDARGIGTHEQLGLEPCGFLAHTGYPCLTCGMTTAFSHMVRGQVARSLHASPAGAVLCLLTIATPLWLAHSYRSGRSALRFFRARLGGYVLPALVAIVLLSWVYKIAVARAPS